MNYQHSCVHSAVLDTSVLCIWKEETDPLATFLSYLLWASYLFYFMFNSCTTGRYYFGNASLRISLLPLFLCFIRHCHNLFYTCPSGHNYSHYLFDTPLCVLSIISTYGLSPHIKYLYYSSEDWKGKWNG